MNGNQLPRDKKTGRFQRKLNYEEIYNFRQNGYSVSKIARMFKATEFGITVALRKYRSERGLPAGKAGL